MGYSEALEAAGATVLAFKDFGSYQGYWVAKVQYKDATGWIISSFGSCSGCDDYEAEVGYCYDDNEEEKRDWERKLAEFGSGYLDSLMTTEEALKSAEEHDRWEPGMLKFVQDNA